MVRLISALLGATTLILSSGNAQAAPTDATYSLAQGCYAVKSPTTGQFMRRHQTSGTINDGWSFDFKASDESQAARFYFKPSGLGSFMLYDQGGRFLDTRFPADITAGNVTGQHANWRIEDKAVSGEILYRFTSQSLNRHLRHNWNSKGIYFIDLLNPQNNDSEDWFKLVPTDNCTEFPEAELNVAGDYTALKGSSNAPIRGSIDPHTHITSYEFMGGTMMAGKPFHPFGVSHALADSASVHGQNGALDVIGNLMGFNDINFRYNTAGWPDFPFWPHHQSLSHTGYYYRWIERAFLGGQRMLVTHLVENEVLCNLQSTLLPQSWGGTNSCNTMTSIDLQILRLHELQDYADAQAGGPGKGFFRIVDSPEQAREVIANGQMAVVMGIEASELFNCGSKDGKCSQAYIESELQNYYDLGVRVIFPLHRFDNQFGGARIEGGLINVGNNKSTGRYFHTSACDDETQGQWMSNDTGLAGLEGLIGVTGTTNYDETTDQCNNRGLTDLGVYLVNRMMDMGMIIELDHMSQRSHEAVLDIAEARGYSGLVSSHSHMHSGPNNTVHQNTVRLLELGGIVAPYNSNTDSLGDNIGKYLDVLENTPWVQGVPFATDMSGIGKQAGPRASAASNPLTYPFETEFGLIIDRQVSGNRSFDLNTDGMAHYGLVADHIQDIREQNPARVYEAVMNSAEAYLQMWERARANTNSDYINPLAPEVTLFNRGAGTCLDMPGNDDSGAGAKAGHYECQPLSLDQRWQFDPESGQLSNKASNHSLCLDNNGTPWNNGRPVLMDCDSSPRQIWAYNGQRITNSQSGQHSLDAYKGGATGFWESHGGANQQWEMRMDSPSGHWAQYRSERSGQCLTANGPGAQITLTDCTEADAQKWQWQASAGLLVSASNPELCLASTGQPGNDVPVLLDNCSSASTQPFELYANNTFRAKQAASYVLDAAGGKVVFYRHHGGSNQRWHATLAD